MIRVSESGATKEQAGLASDLLRRLPLFEVAPWADPEHSPRARWVMDRVPGRGARFSDGMRAAGWDPEFVDDAEDVFVGEVEPAVQEI